MSSGFSNPLVGGGGALVYPSIHSPNFSEAATTGWSIDKNGNAFFYGITTSGAFEGTNFVINTAGAFFYSGPPAAGNLIASIASAAGADQYGNAYPAGMGIYGSGEFLFGNVIINATGIFVYSLPPLVSVTKTSGSGTIPIPAGVTTALAECWGGGGGGTGSFESASNDFTGGAGGEYAAEPALAVTVAGVAYVVGAAGAGGTSAANSTAGGNSTLTGTSVTVTAHGGSCAAAQGPACSSVPGGTGSTNTTHFDGGSNLVPNQNGNLQGGGGNTWLSTSSGATSAGTAAGGNDSSFPATGVSITAPLGGGAGGGPARDYMSGANTNTDINGFAGGAPGGGGGGGGQSLSGTFGTGGNGAAGQVRVTYTPSANPLLLSIAPTAGTDAFGNAYIAGLQFTDANGFQIELTEQGGAGVARFATNRATEASAAILASQVFSPGSGEVLSLAMFGPREQLPNNDAVAVLANSAAADGSKAAQGILGYLAPSSGATVPMAAWGSKGLSVRAYQDGNTYDCAATTLALASNLTINNVAGQTVLSIPVGNASTSVSNPAAYKISGFCECVQGPGNVAQSLGFGGPAATGTITRIRYYYVQQGLAQQFSNYSNLGSALGSPATPAYGAGVTFFFVFEGIVTFTAQGTFGIEAFASSAVNDFTIVSGSQMDVMPRVQTSL